MLWCLLMKSFPTNCPFPTTRQREAALQVVPSVVRLHTLVYELEMKEKMNRLLPGDTNSVPQA